MDSATVKTKLIAVLREVQELSGLECPTLTGTVRPVDSLSKFNSKVWAVATSLLADQIDIAIPNDANIFIDKLTKKPLSIDEAAELVCELIDREHAVVAA